MLKEHAPVLRKLIIFLDLFIVAEAFVLGYCLRTQIEQIYPLSEYIGFLPVLLIIWIGLLYSLGMYESFRVKETADVLLIIFKTAFFGFIIFGAYTYLFKIHYLSRSFIFFVFGFAALLIAFEKIVTTKEFKILMVIIVLGIYLYAQNFILNNTAPIADWGPYL